MLRSLACSVLAAGLCFVAAGCSSDDAATAELPRAGLKPIVKLKTARKRDGAAGTVEQGAAVQLLQSNREEFQKQFAGLAPDAQPGRAAKAFGDYLDAADKFDVKDCPLEVQAAWAKHKRAWRAFHAAVAAVPDGLHDGVEFMEMVESLFGNGPTDRAKPLGADLPATARKVTVTLNGLHTAAEGAGVALQ